MPLGAHEYLTKPEIFGDKQESTTKGAIKSEGYKIPWDAADAITLDCLKYHYQLTKEQLDQYYMGEQWLHRDDIEDQSILLFHLKAVIEYHGGTVE